MSAGAVIALVPPSDPDVWWHVRTGDYILDGHFPRTDPWSLVAHGRPWVLHEWLAQVLLALFHDAFGFRGLSLYRSIGVGCLLGLLALQCFRRTTPYRALGVLCLAVAGTYGGWGERPQLLSWILLVPVAELIRRAAAGTANPWLLVPILYVWANLHGLWVLGIALLGVAVLGLVWEQGWRAARERVALLASVGVACLAAAALTPNGPRLLVEPFRIRPYGQFVSEWGAPSIHTTYGLGFFLMVAVVVISLSASGRKLGRYELAQVLFALLLGTMYIRTVAPAVVILTPLLAALTAPQSPPRKRAPAPLLLSGGILASLVALGIGGATAVLVAYPSLPPGAPVGATQAITSMSPGPQRVINEYVLGGWLLGQAPSVQPAIDGRTEIYPLAYVADYLEALDMSGDWKATIEPLHATAALLNKHTALVNGLKDEWHWRTVYQDDTWIVLAPPSPSSPSGP